MENNSTATGNITGVLAENLRCQYLNVMGIQTWFDPSLVVPSAEILPVKDVKVSVTEPNDQIQVKPETLPSNDSVATQPEQTQINSINNIETLTVKIEQCELCELHTNRKQAISGEGNTAANLFIIIDAPVSDVAGENALFNVTDRKMLQAMLQTIGIQLSSVYISSLVKCHPPGQRAPQISEMICCDEYLSAQIKLIQPSVIMVLGELANQQLLVSQKSLTDLRLRHHKHLEIPVYASYHPRDLLNSSETKRKVWADLLQISKHIR